jgi:hypothetical protein
MLIRSRPVTPPRMTRVYTVSQGRITRIDNYLDSLAWSRYLEQHRPDDVLARQRTQS